MTGMTEEWIIELTRDGVWPTMWRWSVRRRVDGITESWRSGHTFTKDRARRKAVAARRSIERDDVKLVAA